MKKIKLFVFALCAVLMGLTGYYNLLRIDNLEIRFYELSGLSWLFIPFVVRIVTASFFFIPILLLFSLNKVRITSQLFTVIILLILIWDQSYSLRHVQEEVETINFSTIPWLPGIVSIAALALMLLLSVKQPAPSFRYRKIAIGLIAGILIALPFIINPVFPDNFDISESPSAPFDVSDDISGTVTDSQPQLYCFFTANCPYCRKNGKKIYLRLNDEERKNVFVLFPGAKDNAELYLQKTHTTFQYVPEMKEVFKAYDVRRWPTFFLVKDKKIIQRWDGNTFNYAVLNELPKLLSE